MTPSQVAALLSELNVIGVELALVVFMLAMLALSVTFRK